VQDTVQIGDKVYRRRPWRGNANALILIGQINAASGEIILAKEASHSKDPLKRSKAKAKPK
jgi:hypothetical protein